MKFNISKIWETQQISLYNRKTRFNLSIDIMQNRLQLYKLFFSVDDPWTYA